jgi:hypothetical protein
MDNIWLNHSNSPTWNQPYSNVYRSNHSNSPIIENLMLSWFPLKITSSSTSLHVVETVSHLMPLSQLPEQQRRSRFQAYDVRLRQPNFIWVCKCVSVSVYSTYIYTIFIGCIWLYTFNHIKPPKIHQTIL